MVEIFLYAGIGIISGFFSGLLGIGGGIIIVPPMILILTTLLGVDPLHATHIAVATSASIIVFTSVGSAFSHSRLKNVVWQYVRLFAIAVIIGSFLATILAPYLSAKILSIILAIFLFYNSYEMLWKNNKNNIASHPHALPKAIILPIASGISCCATLIGIGGGVLNIPFLKKLGLSIKKAIGSASIINLVISFTATTGYLLNMTPDVTVKNEMIGMVYVSATIWVACFSIITSYLGAKLTAVLSSALLKKIFGYLTLLFAGHLVSSLFK